MEIEDVSIVNLYWVRSENAISETSKKYGNYCYSIAYNILENVEDADESVNDTYFDAGIIFLPIVRLSYQHF